MGDTPTGRKPKGKKTPSKGSTLLGKEEDASGGSGGSSGGGDVFNLSTVKEMITATVRAIMDKPEQDTLAVALLGEARETRLPSPLILSNAAVFKQPWYYCACLEHESVTMNQLVTSTNLPGTLAREFINICKEGWGDLLTFDVELQLRTFFISISCIYLGLPDNCPMPRLIMLLKTLVDQARRVICALDAKLLADTLEAPHAEREYCALQKVPVSRFAGADAWVVQKMIKNHGQGKSSKSQAPKNHGISAKRRSAEEKQRTCKKCGKVVAASTTFKQHKASGECVVHTS
jgi:hypothetical protein